MSSLNRVILIGRVVGPPELKYTPNGTAVATFKIAVDRRPSKNQERQADFIPVKVWQRLAEICNEYLTKGKQIAIEGRLEVRSYEDKDGQKRNWFEVVAEEMQMLGSRSEDGAPPANGGGGGFARQGSGGGGYQQQQRSNAPAPSGGGGGGYRESFGGGGGGGSFSSPGEDDLGMDDVPF